MNLDTMAVQVPYNQAIAARNAYREAIRQEHANEADRQLYAAYRAVAQGKHVIDIVDVLQKAGVDAEQLPKLAVCRADAPHCHFYQHDNEYWFSVSRAWGRRRPYATVSVPRETFPVGTRQKFGAHARAPFIPPQHRPKFNLRHYHILWEAEWQQRPPVDPMLLKHLEGPFYAVLAVWDLTPLEQAVMRGL